jgi:hypothetical protein
LLRVPCEYGTATLFALGQMPLRCAVVEASR